MDYCSIHTNAQREANMANISSRSRTRRRAAAASTQEGEREPASSRLTRIKATFLDHVMWTKFNLKLVMDDKTLQDWVQEQLEELNKIPLSRFKPVPMSQRIRLSPSKLERKHWVPVRVDPDQYRKARWRWSAMGIPMSEWFYQKIKSYAESVDLDAAERAITGRSKAKETRRESSQKS
jgi:hypothetical protein